MKKLYLSDDPVFCYIVFDKADHVVCEIFDSEHSAIAYVNHFSQANLDWRALNVTHIAHCFQFEVERLMERLLADVIGGVN